MKMSEYDYDDAPEDEPVLDGEEAAIEALEDAINDGRLPHPDRLDCQRCGAHATDYVWVKGFQNPLFVEPRCLACQ